MKKRLLSAVQPTGNLHIGNYLGAIKNWVNLQDEYESIFPIVDLHAITTPQDPKKLHENIKKTAAIYIACGIDPKKSKIFIQSEVPAHSELAWILSCNVYIGELERMTQFKNKSKKQQNESVSTGLFTYPTLMVADILLYQTNIVPVGEDQSQHIELTRAIAKRFNSKYSDIFNMPEIKLKKLTRRIMALDNPEDKMSKSAKSEYNYIALLDSDGDIKKKISRAVTDSEKTIAYDSNKRKGLANLLHIYSAFSEKDIEDIVAQYKNIGYKEFKNHLSDLLIEKLSPIRNKTNELLESSELDNVLKQGAEFAQIESEKTLIKVKKAIGLGI